MAVAGVVAAPMAAQAEVTVGGYAGVEYRTTDNVDKVANPDTDSLVWDDFTINVAASSTTDGGSTAYANVRIDMGFSGDGSVVEDNTHVGIKGSFGDVRLGEVADPMHVGQKAGDAGFDLGSPVDTAIGYTNSFGAASLTVALSPEDNDDNTAFAVGFDVAGASIGISSASVGTADTSYIGASMGFGDISLAAHLGSTDNGDTTGIKVGWSSGALSASLAIHSASADVGADPDDVTRLDIDYSLGGGAALNLRNHDGGDDDSYTRVLYSMSF